MFDKLFEFLKEFAGLFQCWVVVDEYERGVMLRFGRFNRELAPGVHICWPLNIERSITDNVVTRTHRLPPQALTTRDGFTTSVTAVVTANIRHIRKALLEVENMDHALVDACSAAITHHVAINEWVELIKDGASDVLTKACREQAWRYGVEIERVQLADLARCKVIRLQTSHSEANEGNVK